MAGELIRFNNKQDLVRRAIEISRREERAQLQITEMPLPLVESGEHHIANPFLLKTPRPFDEEVMDVLRVCTIKAAPYASRYVLGPDGLWGYSGPIEISKRRYWAEVESATKTVLPVKDVAIELCFHCGKTGKGAISCGECKRLVCWGKVIIDENFFRCYCGAKGYLTHAHFENTGFNPSSKGGW
jgi:hypothetical protein